jgi:hypothetical protein
MGFGLAWFRLLTSCTKLSFSSSREELSSDFRLFYSIPTKPRFTSSLQVGVERYMIESRS